jgi:hypothetical protein
MIVDAIVKRNVVAENPNVPAQARIMGNVIANDLFIFSEIAVTTKGGIVALESTANIVAMIASRCMPEPK